LSGPSGRASLWVKVAVTWGTPVSRGGIPRNYRSGRVSDLSRCVVLVALREEDGVRLGRKVEHG
jgi:hypothetical protein